MTYDTLNRISNPVVRNAIIANATYADDADGEAVPNYAYSTDPIKLATQYARKEDYGGIIDLLGGGFGEENYAPAGTVRHIVDMARKFYAGGRNMATPTNQQELIRLIGTLRVKNASVATNSAPAVHRWSVHVG